uniref:Protein tweety homolog n=1 Tax=Haemonchus contortus TaxID=6289 RepID=A0A7I5E9S3_HAECO
MDPNQRVCPTYQFNVIGPIKEFADTTLTALYLRAASSLMNKMVNTVSDSTIHSIGKVLNDTSKVKSAVVRSLMEYPMAFAMFTLWVLLAVFVLISIGLHFAYRLRHPLKSRRPSGQRLLWAALSFGLCFIMSLIGLALYSISLLRVQEGIEDLPLQLRMTTYGIMSFTNSLDSHAGCQLGNIYGHRLNTIIYMQSEVSKALMNNKLLLSFPAHTLKPRMNNILMIEDNLSFLKIQLKKIQNEEFRNAIEPILEKLGEELQNAKAIVSSLMNFDEMLNNALKSLYWDVTNGMEAISNYGGIFHDAVMFVNESTTRVLEEIADVVSKEESNGIIKIVGYSIQIPLILVILSNFALALVMAGWTFHMGRDRYDSRRSRRGAVAIVAASVLGGAGYTAMVIGAVLCVLVAFCFLVAFAAAVVCLGFFVDDYHRLFNAIPNLHYRAKLGTQYMNYSLHDTFYNCKNGHQFFDALNGSHIIAASEIKKEFQLLQRGEDLALELLGNDVSINFQETLRQYIYELRALYTELDRTGSKFYSSQKKYDDQNRINDFVIIMQTRIKPLRGLLNYEGLHFLTKVPVSDKETRDQYANFLNYSIFQLQHMILSTFSNISDTLSDVSPTCDNMIGIWNVMGTYVGLFITVPVQGLWVAYMICVIGSAPIYQAFFSASRFLQDYAESVRKTYLRETQRLEELRYVYRKMTELEDSTQDDLSEDVLGPSQGSASSTPSTATPNTVTPSEKPHAVGTDSVGGAGETQKKSDLSKKKRAP